MLSIFIMVMNCFGFTWAGLSCQSGSLVEGAGTEGNAGSG